MFRKALEIAATADLAVLRPRLGRRLTGDGMPPAQVVSELVADVERGIIACDGGRFFASEERFPPPSRLSAFFTVGPKRRSLGRRLRRSIRAVAGALPERP